MIRLRRRPAPTGPVRVRCRQAIASAMWSLRPGEVVDMDAELAAPFLESGVLEVVDADVPLHRQPAPRFCRSCGTGSTFSGFACPRCGRAA